MFNSKNSIFESYVSDFSPKSAELLHISWSLATSCGTLLQEFSWTGKSQHIQILIWGKETKNE